MSVIVNGRQISEDIAQSLRVRLQGRVPKMAVISVAPNFATKKFLSIKRKFAQSIGVTLLETELTMDATTRDVIEAIPTADDAEGIVLQLPFPTSVEVHEVLAHIPRNKDVDVIGHEAYESFVHGESNLIPPVAGAIAEIAKRHDVQFRGKRVCVVGKGRLVGLPVAQWATQQGAHVVSIDKQDDVVHAVSSAEILVTGVGIPDLIMPHMLAQGVVIFDAGTSEDGGKLAGDVHHSCAEKASLITPVPGGIGPVAVAKLFENLCILSEQNK